ncbi:heavy metal translocating P-type ATPase [Salidesulfovibrio brasiliensis]|uniref:heavy metal translocating P-type ATPase n=1 Tax=Salidesulfovibrio brasiliensis TaxID=221711 RepID=UPI0006CFD381|nr:cation-translocating P-type ATPase [Salidesulfovibrio brasiliensis]
MKKTLKIRHSIPGRVRFLVRSLRRNDELAARLESELAESEGVELVRANARAGTLIVRYDSERTNEAEVARVSELLVDSNAKPRLIAAPSCASPLCECTACKVTERGCDPVRPALRRFTAISLVMGGVFVRRSVLGLAVAETALSPLGIIAIGASVPLFKKALRQIRQRRFTLEAFLGASCVAAVAAGEALTAFEVLWINSGAELLKAWITERSRKSISQILHQTGHHTFVLVDGVEVEAEVRDLKVGDVVVLHTGEKVCVDGEVVDGEALLDESPITGRPDFIPRMAGDEVLAGTFVRQGVIYVRAREVGDRTYLARVLKLVEDSLENRAPIEGVADRLAANLIKVGFVVTGGTLLLTGSLWRAFTVMLVMACPCATVLSASTAISAAMSAAARRNILIKGGRYLEELSKVDTVCFDKTGTLTTTEPVLESVVPVGGIGEERLLQLAVSAEVHNHHPLAQAVKMEADRRDVSPVPHTVCEYFLGMGMRAEITGAEVLVGNRKLMERYGVRVGGVSSRVSAFRKRGLTVLYVAREGNVEGLLAFDNTIRPESAAVVARLLDSGVKHTVLVTGDEKNTANELADRLGIRDCHSSVMPEDKAVIVDRLQQGGASVLMIGDGINDALALTEADVGVAMGAGGSEVAVEAADIALVNDDLRDLVYVHALSRNTLSVVHQNFWIATGSNIVGVVLGATGLLSPVMAGLLHIVHSLGVMANSSRLLRYDIPALTGAEDQ